MKSLICKLLGHRSVVVGGDYHGGGLLCERCGHVQRVCWSGAFSEVTVKEATRR